MTEESYLFHCRHDKQFLDTLSYYGVIFVREQSLEQYFARFVGQIMFPSNRVLLEKYPCLGLSSFNQLHLVKDLSDPFLESNSLEVSQDKFLTLLIKHRKFTFKDTNGN